MLCYHCALNQHKFNKCLHSASHVIHNLIIISSSDTIIQKTKCCFGIFKGSKLILVMQDQLISPKPLQKYQFRGFHQCPVTCMNVALLARLM